MITLPLIVTGCCAALFLLLAAVQLASRTCNFQKALFILACLTLGAAVTFLTLAMAAPTPQRALAMLQIFVALLIFAPAVMLPFFFFFARDRSGAVSRRLPGIIILAVLLAAAGLLVPIEAVIELLHFEAGAAFWGFTLSGAGIALCVYILFVNILCLHAFENTFREATVAARVTLKYPLLGLVCASTVNFAVTTGIIALARTDRDHLAAGAGGLILFAVSMLYAGARYPLFEVRAAGSRRTGTSVITIVVAGFYLLAAALISYASARTGMSYDRFFLVTLGIFSVFLVLAIVISGRARRYMRRFVQENFRPGAYNYRREWPRYMRLMTSSPNVEDFMSNTISSLCETVMVRRGLIWAAVGSGRTALYGLDRRRVECFEPGRLTALYNGAAVAFVDAGRRGGGAGGRPGSDFSAAAAEAALPDWISAVAFLGTGGETKGLIALGPKDFGARWTEEDRDFLAMIADQATLTLENYFMSDRLLEAKQLESFNRFASFVVHDLKNTVGMLSLTAANARDNINDRAFQEDAIDTIERSVSKMRALIDSLNAHRCSPRISRTTTDVRAVIEERIALLRQAAEAAGVRIGLQAPAGLTAHVDPAAVGRIVENLVLNGIEALGAGGSVKVALRREGVALKITVADDGPGFAPDYLAEDLFRPFRTTKANGLGVGLVLCRALAEAHGGAVAAGNRPGGGASVSVVLPAGED